MANKSVFSPTQAQDLLYEPRWPLDPSGKEYFPPPKALQITPKAETLLLRDVSKCRDLVQRDLFEEDVYVRGIRAAYTLNQLEQAKEMSVAGLALCPENKMLVKLLYKVTSRIQTHELFNTSN